MENDQFFSQQIRALQRRFTILAFAFMLLVGYVAVSQSIDVRAQSTPRELTLSRLQTTSRRT